MPREDELLSFLHLIGSREHRRRGREAPMEGTTPKKVGAAWGGEGWRRRTRGREWVAAADAVEPGGDAAWQGVREGQVRPTQNSRGR